MTHSLNANILLSYTYFKHSLNANILLSYTCFKQISFSNWENIEFLKKVTSFVFFYPKYETLKKKNTKLSCFLSIM